MQPGCTPTVGEAAKAFCVPVERVVQAVDWHDWMYRSTGPEDPAEQRIQHDGE